MGKMNRNAVRKMDANSPEYYESNLWIFDKSPQECWNVIWETNRQLMNLSGGKINFNTPLRRDIVKKFYRNENKELVEIK